MPSIDIPIGHHDEMEAECLMERFRLRHPNVNLAPKPLRWVALRVQAHRRYGRIPRLIMHSTGRIHPDGFRKMTESVLGLSRSQRRDYITLYYQFDFANSSEAVMFKMKLDCNDQP